MGRKCEKQVKLTEKSKSVKNIMKCVREAAKLHIIEDNRELMTSSIVQYVIVRGDLLRTMNWPTGALIAQACHACSAAIHLFHDDDHTQQYLADLDNMHKVVLEAPSEDSLKNLEIKLKENNIKHKLWIEQPENIPTCLVLKPYPKQDVQGFVKKFKLFK